MKKGVWIFILILVVSNVLAIEFKGFVFDKDSKEPIISASVSIVDESKMSYTDDDGSFTIKGLKEGPYSIRVMRIGYESMSKEITISNDKTLSFGLEKKAEEINGITVSGTRAKKRETPVTFSNLPEEEIKISNYGQDIPMLMSEMPNVFAYSDAGNGLGYSYLKIRGFDQKRIGVMVNGIPLNDPEDHNVYWVNMPDFGESLSDIQFQRGVGSSLYGVSTFGGSVNLNTSKISEETRYELFANYGTYETYKTGVKITQNLGRQLKMNLRFSQLGSDGYRDNAGTELHSYFFNLAHTGTRSFTEFNFYGGNEVTHAAWYASWEGDLEENHQHNPITYDNEIDDFSQPHFELHNSYLLSENTSLKNSIFYIRGDGFYEQYKDGRDLWEYGLASTPDSLESDLIRQKLVEKNQYGWIGQFNWDHNDGNLMIGSYISLFDSEHWGEIKELLTEEEIQGYDKGFEYYNYEGKKRYISFYINENYKVNEKINLMLNVQYQNINFQFDQQEAGNFAGEFLNSYEVDYNFISPRLGLNYNLNKEINFYTNLSLAQREPTDSELYDTWMGPDDLGVAPLFAEADTIYNSQGEIERIKWSDPEVKEEKLADVEFGMHYTNDFWSISANYYHMIFEDEIVSYGGVDEDGSPIRGNADKTIHRGVELSASRLLPWNLKINTNLAWSQNYFEEFIMYDWDDDYNVIEVDYKDKTIAGFPDIIASASVDYVIDDLNMSLKMMHIGEQYLDNTENEDRTIDAYQLLGFRALYTFTKLFNNLDVSLSLNVENLLDKEYETSGYYDPWGGPDWSGANYYFPGAGRTIIGGLRIAF